MLCAVDGSPGSREALHQAISLCRGGGSLRFVAARHDLGSDPSLPLDLTEMQARNALELALALARRAGVEASVSLLRGRPVPDLLLGEAEKHRLLVLGAPRRARGGEAPLGRTAAEVVRRAPRPVLIAGPGTWRSLLFVPAGWPDPDPASVVLHGEAAAGHRSPAPGRGPSVSIWPRASSPLPAPALVSLSS